MTREAETQRMKGVIAIENVLQFPTAKRGRPRAAIIR